MYSIFDFLGRDMQRCVFACFMTDFGYSRFNVPKMIHLHATLLQRCSHSKVADFGPVPSCATATKPAKVPSNGGDEVMQAALQGLEQRQSQV